uniref:Conserved oligomeric Golgi complex subunit 1 n=1 Tax=Amphiprion percula TaxID=161767 RepID=A0A3P8S6Y4_AMPPE
MYSSAFFSPFVLQEGLFPMTQNRALQLLFDLRYLNTTSGRTVRLSFHEVCDWLESFIDPFDLDVFTPPLNANLNRLSQRTSVLLGLLTGSEKQFVLRSSGLNSQEPFNILPLASSQIRSAPLKDSFTVFNQCLFQPRMKNTEVLKAAGSLVSLQVG